MNNLNVNHMTFVSRLIRISPVAKAFFDWMDQRQYGARVTCVHVAVRHTGQDYYEIVALFKILAEQGYGTFRKGWGEQSPSRMEWVINPKLYANDNLMAA
jgi:hypothetical protein